jgi:peptidyl-prolyl cis-trans isomerase C
MRVIKKLVLLLVVGTLLVGGLQAVHADGLPRSTNQIPPIPDVVARVNGSDILAKHIKFEFMRVLKNARAPMTFAQKDKVVRKAIDKEVVRELMYQEGQKLSLKVDTKLVEAELKALRSAYKGDDDFKKALAERNITEDDLKKSIEVDTLAEIILEKQVKGHVKIDDTAVQKYYVDNKEKFRRPIAFRASLVFDPPFFCCESCQEEMVK